MTAIKKRPKNIGKSGPRFRAHDLAHLAWRAGVIEAWWVMEDEENPGATYGSTNCWSLVIDGVRTDKLSVKEFHQRVEDQWDASGIQRAMWGGMWIGYRSIVNLAGEPFGTPIVETPKPALYIVREEEAA